MTENELETCKKVASYLRQVALPYLADIYDTSPQTEAKRHLKTSFFLEFYIVFYPSEVKRVNEKLLFAMRQYSKEIMSGTGLKKICDEWIKAHTVAWCDGVPYWKSKEVNQ